MYSHLHPSGRVYEANPKPVGLGFGGTLGSERIFVDEDFAKVTVRHHAVDKTFQNGSLIPNQVELFIWTGELKYSLRTRLYSFVCITFQSCL